jgi:hypothetical protein
MSTTGNQPPSTSILAQQEANMELTIYLLMTKEVLLVLLIPFIDNFFSFSFHEMLKTIKLKGFVIPHVRNKVFFQISHFRQFLK